MQRMPEVDEALQKVFLFGVSTRRCGQALSTLLGDSVIAQTISTLAKSLDAEVKVFHGLMPPYVSPQNVAYLSNIIKKGHWQRLQRVQNL